MPGVERVITTRRTPSAARERNLVLQQMAKDGTLDPHSCRSAPAAGFDFERHTLPGQVAHVAQQVRKWLKWPGADDKWLLHMSTVCVLSPH
jgi:hypothetical protein